MNGEQPTSFKEMALLILFVLLPWGLGCGVLLVLIVGFVIQHVRWVP